MKVIILCISLFSALNILACTCGLVKKITNEEIKNVNEVFIGKVKSITIDTDKGILTAIFEVKEEIKGELHNSEIIINTINGSSACGLDFSVGQVWYIFAHKRDGVLHAGLCGRSVQLKKVKYYLKGDPIKYFFLSLKYFHLEKKRVRDDKQMIRKYKRKLN